MEHLIAQADQSLSSSAVLSVPIQTLPSFSHTQQCAYIAKVLRSNNIRASDSIRQVMKSKGSSANLLLQGMIVRAISSVCTRVSPEEMSQAKYINFYPSVDLNSSLVALEHWLSDGVSISGVETMFEDALLNPTGDSALVASLVTLREGQKFGNRHVGQHAQIAINNSPQGIKEYIKSLDNSLAVGPVEGVKILLNGCETTLNAAALRNFGKPNLDKESALWQSAITQQMNMAVDHLLVSNEAAQAVNSVAKQGNTRLTLMVLYTAESDGANPFNGWELDSE